MTHRFKLLLTHRSRGMRHKLGVCRADVEYNESPTFKYLKMSIVCCSP